MTNIPAGEGMNTSNTSTARARGRIAVIVIAAIGFVVGAIVGAYLNWFWWEIGYRPLTIILAVAILVVGCIVSMISRVIVRRIALFILAVGFGLLAGHSTWVRAASPSSPSRVAP